MAQLYQVIFNGRLQDGTKPEQAARDFAAVFKVPEDKAWKLVSGESTHVLKRDVDESTATRYREILEEIGLDVRIEAAGLQPDGDPETAEGRETGAATAADRASRAAEDARAPHTGDGSTRNPYAPPAADLTPPARDAGGPSMTGPHKVPPSHGWHWIKQAWRQYAGAPWPWAAAVVLLYAINMLLSFVPVIGSLASLVLGPVFLGGLMLGARAQDRSGGFRTTAVFDGFSRNGGQLALVGVLYFVALMAAFMVAAALTMAGGAISASAMEALASNDPEAVAAVMGPGILLLLLIVMLLIVPIIMAYWFAPALVAIDDMPAMQAMLTSFRACLMNIVPFLIYGLAFLAIMVGGGLVFGLAAAAVGAVAGPLAFIVALLAVPLLIVFGTVIVASIYTGYRDVFYQGAGSAGGSTWAAR